MSSSGKVRIGVVGMGIMGAAHAAWIRDGLAGRAVLAAVCDTDPGKLSSFGEAVAFTSNLEMIRSGRIDAVLIATPHYDHTTVGIAALEEGLHVLVEKPISAHKADCERLLAAHKNSKQKFAAMFQMRTAPHYARIKQMITDGDLGSIKRILWEATHWFRSDAYYGSGKWRATWSGEGGGVLLNQCPHQLDLLQWLFGMPKSVRAHCGFGRYHTIAVEDDVTAFMEFPDGYTGVFVATTGESPGTNRLEVACDRGRLILENDRISFIRTEVSVGHFCRTSEDGFAHPAAEELSIPAEGTGGEHVDIIRNFVDAILDDVPLIAPASEGINSVELANAFVFSSLMDRTVELPLDSWEYGQQLELLKRKETVAV